MKKRNLLLYIFILLMPLTVFAESKSGNSNIPLIIFFETILTILAIYKNIIPFSKIFNDKNSRKVIVIFLLLIRIFLLMVLISALGPVFVFYDLLIIYILNKIIKVIGELVNANTQEEERITVIPIKPLTEEEKVLKCPNCSAMLKETDKFCQMCGKPVDTQKIKELISRIPSSSKDYDLIYSLSEDKMIEEFINRELKKEGLSSIRSFTTKDLQKKKIIINTIMSLLIFTFLSLIFFHFPKITYVIGIIILVVVFILSRKVNILSTIIKDIKARPEEKISNIVMSTKENLVKDYSRIFEVLTTVIAIVLPLAIFYEPRIFYEKMENGYGVRFYTYGLTNNETVNIPETYKGEKVVSLRGNAFSNMRNLREVVLPDSITEIRGQAFKNDVKLKKVKLPKNLKSLGGSAFKNCESLEEIEIPETVTFIDGGAFYNAKSLRSIKLPNNLEYLGGEAFYNATSLETVELGDKLTEIRGDTFEYCTSLRSIKIPDSVTRIGGHAFYGDLNLSKVEISQNSKLTEIGSSAFRQCTSLYEITLPQGISVNERAFKESPTIINYYGLIEDYDYNTESIQQ